MNANSLRISDKAVQPTKESYAANRQKRVVDAKGFAVEYVYDANSNVIQIVSVEKPELGGLDEVYTTLFEFDGLDRLIRRTDAAGNVVDFAYDSRGNLVRTSDARRASPSAPGNIVVHEYDGLDRLIRTIREMTDAGFGGGAVTGTVETQQTWDASSRLTGQIDDNGNATVYVYDPLDRVVATQFADGTAETVEYDIHDNPVVRADANGSVVTTSFDLLGRPVARSIAPGAGVAGTTAETMQWDGLSRLVRADDDDSSVTLAYDSLSNNVRETLAGLEVLATFDAEGNELGLTYPGGRELNWTYDELHRIATIADAASSFPRHRPLARPTRSLSLVCSVFGRIDEGC